jgi:hypothetical protein
MNEEGQPQHTPPPSRGATAWLREGARVLAFRRPDWEGLEAPICAGPLPAWRW